MKRIFGFFALVTLILSIGMVVYLFTSPLYALLFTPYLVLTSALTLSFSVGYFYELNEIKNRLLDIIVYSIAFIPTIIPLIACFDPDFMESYWRSYLSMTLLQLGTGVLAATLFFRNPGINFSNFCAAISSLLLFIMGVLIILELSILGSIPFLIIIAGLVSILFFVALIRRIKELN